MWYVCSWRAMRIYWVLCFCKDDHGSSFCMTNPEQNKLTSLPGFFHLISALEPLRQRIGMQHEVILGMSANGRDLHALSRKAKHQKIHTFGMHCFRYVYKDQGLIWQRKAMTLSVVCTCCICWTCCTAMYMHTLPNLF